MKGMRNDFCNHNSRATVFWLTAMILPLWSHRDSDSPIKSLNIAQEGYFIVAIHK